MLHVRRLCEAAAGSLTGHSQGEAALALVQLNKSETHTLQEFVMIQGAEGDKALASLKALRKQVVAMVWEACAVSNQVRYLSFQGYD